MVEQLAAWMAGQKRVLVELDAPLGWPEPLGRLLSSHSAGGSLGEQPNRLFRRETDRYVKQHLGKLPLDVGADRIARTAHAALALLNELRQRTGESIPLVWNEDYPERIGAIEVYPAGTLSAAGVRCSGYKEPAKVAERKEIIAWLAPAGRECRCARCSDLYGCREGFSFGPGDGPAGASTGKKGRLDLGAREELDPPTCLLPCSRLLETYTEKNTSPRQSELIMLHEAHVYEPLGGSQVLCTSCPHDCRIPCACHCLFSSSHVHPVNPVRYKPCAGPGLGLAAGLRYVYEGRGGRERLLLCQR